MKCKKVLTAAAIAVLGAIGTTASAQTIDNADPGVYTPFGGFDWASGSAAWTAGFLPVVNDTFNLLYAGYAANITMLGGGNFFTPGLDNAANGVPNALYEYTVRATFTERVVSCGVSSCEFEITGGTFDIFYDVGQNARTQVGAWTGFGDGVLLISGTFNPSITNQLFNTATGGQADLIGAVTFTNGTYITPALVGTNVTSTLQLGSAVTNFPAPTSVDGTAVGVGEVVFQADANQTFTTRVPEPGVLGLMGLALAACGFVSRRRHQV